MSKQAYVRLSKITCDGCGTRLRQDLIDRKVDARWCPACYNKDFTYRPKPTK